jgi:ubiquinone/menaquinone biosynthesis C-methylase UbiE
MQIFYSYRAILRLPIKTHSVDYSFSIGALHHMTSPATWAREAFRVTKRMGKFAIRISVAKGFYTYHTVRFWRGLFFRIKPTFRHYSPLIHSYLFATIGYWLGKIWSRLGYPLRAVFPTVWMPDYR